ncbi:MAG TPA: AbrB family transcriptional regulator [Devosia sp.]|nr:AbrB family transcriptional regulator [Devosia sp.]
MDERNTARPAGRQRLPIASLPRPAQWAVLLAGSAALAVALEMLHLPAALLLGPMIMGVAFGAGEADVRIPAPLFMTAQAVIGCLMARSLPAAIFAELVGKWPLYALGIGSVIAVAAALGILLTRLRVLPGTTAVWGSAPGASTAMILMADAFGADTRLVAFMLYLRVVMVAFTASIVSRLFVGGEAVAAPAPWFPAVAPLPFAETCAVIAVGLALTRGFKVPAGNILLPMALCALLQDLAGMQIELPPALLAVSYALVGWTIGLRFTRAILAHAARALPAVLGSLVALLLACGGFALMLVWFAGVDPLTAYLATSPGGADSVAIIAASSRVDVPFVMAMQAGRFIVVMAIGPALARFIATRPGLQGR